jgi:protoporphyrin/coproporphyrin ferrochelatase
VTTPLDVLNTPPGDDEQPGVNPSAYDAVVLVSFGGPEGPDDVLPFMQNVTRGRGIPAERLVQVSQHYNLFGGVSPINGQNRQLIAALETEFALHAIDLPIYWGNRNWTPYLADTMAHMKDDGVGRALAFVTSAYSSYSGCRQYREDIIAARETVGEDAPVVDKIRVFYNHPGFIEPMVDGVLAALSKLYVDGTSATHLAFTAHSIPMANAESSDYVVQLRNAAQLVAEAVFERTAEVLPWDLVFQSRSGAPGQPWLEPDICDHLATLHEAGAGGVLMVPIGFISDHMEVVYDLDTQAREKAVELGLPLARSATVGTDPRFVRMIRLLVQERIALAAGLEPDRLCVGERGANHDVCPLDCCPAPARPTSGPGAAGAAGGAPGGRPSASSGDGVLGRPVSEGGAGSAPGRPLSDRTSTPPALRPENGGATS